MEKKNTGVEAVDKALQILNAFREKREELTLTEIANQINQYKSCLLYTSPSPRD